MAEGFDIRHDQTFGVELYELEVPEAAEARPEVTRRLPQLSPRLRAMVKWGVGLISAEVGLLVAVVALHDTVALVGVAGLLALLALGACLHGLSDKLVAGEKGQVPVLSLIVGSAFLVGAVTSVAIAASQHPKQKGSQPESPPVASTPHLTRQSVDVRAQHVLATPTGMYWWGGRYVGHVGSGPLIAVPADIDDVAVCSNSLVISYGSGFAARYRLDGRRRAHIWISTVPARVTCDDVSTYFTVPLDDGTPPYVLRVRTRDLVAQAEIALGGRLGAIHVAFNKLLVGDLLNGLVADVSVGEQENFVRDRMYGIPEASVIEPYGDGALVLEPDRGCVRRLYLNSDQPDDEGIRLQAPVVATAHAGDTLLILYDGGRRVIRVAADTLHPLGPAVDLPGDFRAVSLDRVDGVWKLFDPREHLILNVSGRFLRALESNSVHRRAHTLPPCM